MKTKAPLIIGVVLVLSGLWIATEPPSYHEIGTRRTFDSAPADLMQADRGDAIKAQGMTIAPQLPGHDEILPLPDGEHVLVSGRDEWIWRVNVTTGAAEKLAYSPVSPTGARLMPGQTDQVYFCMARLDHHQYDNNPGLYRLDLTTRAFTEIVTRVPLTGKMRADGLEKPNFDEPYQEKVYTTPFKETAVSELNATNSRILQFCNDLDVTSDGSHIYISEPFSHPNASSGLGAIPEGITLARNGRVWRYDTVNQRIGLVLENNIFADGILIEQDSDGKEAGLLISETVNSRIGRVHLKGPKAGQYEVLWDNLPGLPDGIDRDDQGRIWIALIKDRTPLMTWMHHNPWIKPLVLRIPPQWLSSSKGTAILGLSADANSIIAYSHHNGSRLLDISVVAPAGDVLYLPSFYKNNTGLHYVPINALLKQ